MKRGKAGCPSVTEPINKPNPGQVTHRLIREFKRVPINKDGKNTGFWRVYWVVHWSSAPKPKFEIRRIYQKLDGAITTYEACGFNEEEWKWIAEHQDEITEALQG